MLFRVALILTGLVGTGLATAAPTPTGPWRPQIVEAASSTIPVTPSANTAHSFTAFLTRADADAGKVFARHAEAGNRLSDAEIRAIGGAPPAAVTSIVSWIGSVCGGEVHLSSPLADDGHVAAVDVEEVRRHGSSLDDQHRHPHRCVSHSRGARGARAFGFAARNGHMRSAAADAARHLVALHKHADSVTVTTNVRCAERLFSVSLSQFSHKRTGRAILRTTERPGIPARMRGIIDVVLGVWDFPAMKRIGSGARAESSSRPAPDTSAEAAASRRASGMAPEIVSLHGLDRAFQVGIIPICPNGQPASGPASSPPCSETGVEVTSAVVTYGGQHLVSQSGTAPASSFQCAGSPLVCTISSSSLAPATAVENYVPTLVKVYLNFVDGVTSAPAASAHPFVASPPVILETLRREYGIPDGTVVKSRKSTSCVVEFEEQYYSSEDLNMFLADNGLPQNPEVSVIGPNVDSNPGGEANLDIQWMMGIAPGSPMLFWSIKQNSTLQVDNILSWQTALMNMDAADRPLVTSISYGMAAMYVDQFFGSGYLARSDEEFAKIATTDSTVVIADGDTGVFDDVPPFSLGCNSGKLRPDWPSQSPHIIAVSSTFLTPYSSPICYGTDGIDCRNEPIAETAVSVDHGLFWTTGGGFADTQPRPSYQDAAVATYLNTTGVSTLPPSSHFSAQGRAYPDVAAVGHNLMCRISGQLQSIDGTSASSPIFAAVLVLINGERIAAGLPPLGFTNARLYANPHVFRDITVGNNGCGAYDGTANPACCYEEDSSYIGFTAVPGWDPITGLGTPANYAELLAAMLQSS